MRFFLDAGVPDPVALPLSSAGHEVVLHRDLLAEGSSDDLVCSTAIVQRAILVAVDRDMRRLARPYGTRVRGQVYDALDLVNLLCGEWLAAARLAHAMTFIEHEWKVRESKRARRMWLDIGQHFLRTHR